MVKLGRPILIFCLCLLSAPAKSQGDRYSGIDHLYSISDEIFLISIIKDEPSLWRSLMTCFSDVTATISEVLKATRFSGKTYDLKFNRIMHCDDMKDFPREKLLRPNHSYLVFLVSHEPESGNFTEPIVYELSDYILGVQELNEDMYIHLRGLQREEER